MAHIRQKFKGKLSGAFVAFAIMELTDTGTHSLVLEGNLDGYQKKKYLAKVVFTYILGYKVDVGHMEAVNLISSNKYSEKQIVSSDFARHGYCHRRLIDRSSSLRVILRSRFSCTRIPS